MDSKNSQRPTSNYTFRFITCLLAFLLTACGNNNYTPKPRGYFRIKLPEKKYQLFDKPGYPYTFEYPVYAKIVKDSSFFSQAPENPYWINIVFPDLDGKIYLSYKAIGADKNKFSKLVDDAFKMTYKNTYKANRIMQKHFKTANEVSGLFYEVGGNAATAKQFFATDSVKHFLRGALYFYAVPNEDSLAPVNNFVEQDMWHLLKTLKWK